MLLRFFLSLQLDIFKRGTFLRSTTEAVFQRTDDSFFVVVEDLKIRISVPLNWHMNRNGSELSKRKGKLTRCSIFHTSRRYFDCDCLNRAIVNNSYGREFVISKPEPFYGITLQCIRHNRIEKLKIQLLMSLY